MTTYRTFLTHLAIQTLIHPDFYGNPVELEPVEDMHLYWALMSTSANGLSPTSQLMLHGKSAIMLQLVLHDYDFQAYIPGPISSASTPTPPRLSSERSLN